MPSCPVDSFASCLKRPHTVLALPAVGPELIDGTPHRHDVVRNRDILRRDTLRRAIANVDSLLFEDVGYAKASSIPYERFVNRFRNQIHILHLYDNDGTADDHDPLPEFERIASTVGVKYNMFDMKSLPDITVCVRN